MQQVCFFVSQKSIPAASLKTALNRLLGFHLCQSQGLCEQFNNRAQQRSVLTERGGRDFDHATDAGGGMGVEGAADSREKQFAGAEDATQDERIWLKGVDVAGRRGSQP